MGKECLVKAYKGEKVKRSKGEKMANAIKAFGLTS